MKIAVIGSRDLNIDTLEPYLPDTATEIVSGGARGVDAAARKYAMQHGLPLKEFLPDYENFGRSAPIRRNIEIIEYADVVFAFWNGHSAGTRFVISKCLKIGKPVRIFLASDPKKEV